MARFALLSFAVRAPAASPRVLLVLLVVAWLVAALGAGVRLARAQDGGAPALETVRKGLVIVEREGKPLAAGTVLGGDGRILTALSALGGAEQVDVRYADGHPAHAKVMHKDAAWDLALLVPLSGRWIDGLRASDVDPLAAPPPEGVTLRAAHPSRPKPSFVVVAVRGKVDARARDGAVLLGALDVEGKASATPIVSSVTTGTSGLAGLVGAPLLDAAGNVTGVLVRACRMTDAGACLPGVVGAPVSALRGFIVRTPTNAVPPAPFLGIVGTAETAGAVRGVRVAAVAPASPAEKGGLKAGADVIVAVDGEAVDAPEKLAEAIGRHAVGDAVKLLVYEGKFRELTVTLRGTP